MEDFVLNRASGFLVQAATKYCPPGKQVSDTLSHNVVSSTPRLNGIRTHNVIDDMD
jgi:hypothetical protein